MDYNQILEEARFKAKQRDTEFEKRYAAARHASMTNEEIMRERYVCFRVAGRQEYEQWLRGYLGGGGSITHVYDYPWSRWRWKTAIVDVEIVPLYGYQSFQIIVPCGVQVTGDSGHCGLFWMDGYRCTGIVPIFSDTKL